MVQFLIKRHVSARTLAGVCEHNLPKDETYCIRQWWEEMKWNNIW